ncbi:hypothetical protein EE612_029705, partial [Oryza sativa]
WRRSPWRPAAAAASPAPSSRPRPSGPSPSLAPPSRGESPPIDLLVPVIVFVLLLHAAVEESDCDKIHKGVYAGAGVLVLVSTVLGIISYLMLRTRPEPTPPIVVPMVIAFQPVYPNPLLVPVPVQAPPPNQAFAHPATLPPQGGWYGQAPNQQFAAPAPAQGYGWQAPNQQHFPCAGVVP